MSALSPASILGFSSLSAGGCPSLVNPKSAGQFCASFETPGPVFYPECSVCFFCTLGALLQFFEWAPSVPSPSGLLMSLLFCFPGTGFLPSSCPSLFYAAHVPRTCQVLPCSILPVESFGFSCLELSDNPVKGGWGD